MNSNSLKKVIFMKRDSGFKSEKDKNKITKIEIVKIMLVNCRTARSDIASQNKKLKNLHRFLSLKEIYDEMKKPEPVHVLQFLECLASSKGSCLLRRKHDFVVRIREVSNSKLFN